MTVFDSLVSTNYIVHGHSWTVNTLSPVKQCPGFMESDMCSQDPSTGPSPKLNESWPHLHTFFCRVHFNTIFQWNISLQCPCLLRFSKYCTILYAFISSMHANYHNFPWFTYANTRWEIHILKLLVWFSASSCCFSLSSYIFLCTFPQTLSLCVVPFMWETKFHTHMKLLPIQTCSQKSICCCRTCSKCCCLSCAQNLKLSDDVHSIMTDHVCPYVCLCVRMYKYVLWRCKMYLSER